MGTYDISALKNTFGGAKQRTLKNERSDLIAMLETKRLHECKELYEFVKANKKEFTESEIEVYKAASTAGGLMKLKKLDKKKARAKQAGLKLSQLKKGAFEDDVEWENIQNGVKAQKKVVKKRCTRRKKKVG